MGHVEAVLASQKGNGSWIPCLVALIAFWLGATRAGAQEVNAPPRWGLRIDAPEGDACLSAEEIRERVEGLMERPVFIRSEATRVDGTVLVRLWADDPGWNVIVELLDAQGHPQGSRSVEDPAESCAALSEAIALIVSVMLDPQRGVPDEDAATTTPNEGNSSSEETQEPANPDEPAEGKDTMERGPETGGLSLGIGAGAEVIAGLLPEPAVGPSLSAWLALHPIGRLEARGSYFFAQQVAVEAGSGSFEALRVGLSACPSFVFTSRWALDGCLGLLAGTMTGTGRRFSGDNSSETELLLDAVASVRGWAFISGGLFVRLGARASAPLVRNEFAYVSAT